MKRRFGRDVHGQGKQQAGRGGGDKGRALNREQFWQMAAHGLGARTTMDPEAHSGFCHHKTQSGGIDSRLPYCHRYPQWNP